MNGIVCHFTKVDKTSLASARIALYLARKFGLKVLDRPNPDLVRDYDIAICVSSPSGFAPEELRQQVGEVCARAKHYVFAQNDYMTSQAGQIGKWFDKLGKDRSKRHVWANMPHVCKNPWDTYINWNMLTWSPQELQEPAIDGLFYYGACRADRAIYFKKYFGGELPYRGVISTTTRGASKFRETCPNAEYEGPFDDPVSIARFTATLYIEDTRIHRYYNSPANRFYEALSVGTAMLFDKSCIGTFDKAGHDIRPYVVHNKDDVVAALVHWEEIRNKQRQEFARNFRAELDALVEESFNGLS